MAGLVMVKVRVEIGELMEWAILVCLALGNMLLTVWIGARLQALFANAITNLDGTVAAAIKSLIEHVMGDLEQINPVQAAIAQFITTRMSDPKESVMADFTRDPNGKFSQP